MKIKAFITHKKAEEFNDCQDRFSVCKDTKSIAVSDGMSQSWYQKKWAELLATTYATNQEWVPTLESVKQLSPQWREWVKSRIDALRKRVDAGETTLQHILFRNERNFNGRKSAGATLVGVRFDGFKWKCEVLGDSCLIERMCDGSFEFRTSQHGDFDNYPDYFDSDELRDGKGAYVEFKGELNDKTSLLLMVSDPFSDFLFERKKEGDIEKWTNELLEISNHDEFEKLVADWREKGMHNDDTTLITIEYDGSAEFNVEYEDDINKLIDIEEGNEDKAPKLPILQSDPVKKQESAPVEQTVSTPVSESESAPVEQTVSTPVKKQESAPVKKPEPVFSKEISKEEFVKEGIAIYKDVCRKGKKTKTGRIKDLFDLVTSIN